MTKKELDNLKERAALNNVQERSGVTIGKMQGSTQTDKKEVVYMPYGDQGKGFYSKECLK